MKARTRKVLTAVSLLYIAAVAALIGRVPLPAFNLLLAFVALPLVWLIGAFARWSAQQHSRRWARDIEKVKGTQVRPPVGQVRR